MKRASAALLVALLAPIAHAQEAQPEEAQPEPLPAGHPPVEGEATPAAPLPPGHPPVEAEPAPSEPLPAGHPPVQGSATQQPSMASVLREPTPARAAPSASVPAGTIRVVVVDENDRPVRDTPVDLGVMASGGERTRQNARTNAEGVATFTDLATGTSQAYRVNVPFRGATYSSTPFQLESDRGHDVRVVRLPVTRDDRFVFFNLYRVIIEIVEERFKVIHHAELTNAGRETYVFPRDGLRVRLPEGALAFQAQASMTDQRVEELAGRHMYAIRGSLPPGTVRLAWTYDIPLGDDPTQIPVAIPMRIFGLQVFAQAAEQLRMEVRGMPPGQRIENEGIPFWGTELRRRPTDPPLEQITIVLSDIPGPGPLRWFAAGLAVILIVLGIFLVISRVDDRGAAARARRLRRDALLAEAAQLEKDLADGEIGPEFCQTRRAEIVRELAVLLHEEDAAKRAGSPTPVAAHQAR